MTAPRVVLATGHMVDLPDRATPRFPADQVARVTTEVRLALAAWQVGPDSTVVCGGARGADLIVAEEAHARGARIVLCLALPRDEFMRRSVDIPGTDWLDRFQRIAGLAEIRVLGDATGGEPDDVFTRANAWMVDVARELDPRPHTVVVWNGRDGDGPGGTKNMVRELGVQGPDPRVRVIDPTRRAYEVRQDLLRPKRLLSLDGGGMRGMLSLQVLATIESRLRDRLRNPRLVLADYFDYIAGASTGALIAAGLALGNSVEQVEERYRSLASIVHQRRFLPTRVRSVCGDGPLRRELGTFGVDRTLGDADLRTLLLIVMHNTVTDCPWMLSNCTRAKYNRADRNLLPTPDRNLDIPLAPLLRASATAPSYFPPEELHVGQNLFLFQNGGVTPFSNPALLHFLMATLPQYGLRWETGEDRLLIVSIGSGSSAAMHPGLRRHRVNPALNATNLQSVFMNGAAVSQDLLCRSFGCCRFGTPIDREVGHLVGAPGIGNANLFSYVRYDADLSDQGLTAFGVTDPKMRKQVRKLDPVDELLRDLGQHVAADVDIDRHFRGFLA